MAERKKQDSKGASKLSSESSIRKPLSSAQMKPVTQWADIELDGQEILLKGKVTATSGVEVKGNLTAVAYRLDGANHLGMMNAIIMVTDHVIVQRTLKPNQKEKGTVYDRKALGHSESDHLVLNQGTGYRSGVLVEGPLQVLGPISSEGIILQDTIKGVRFVIPGDTNTKNENDKHKVVVHRNTILFQELKATKSGKAAFQTTLDVVDEIKQLKSEIQSLKNQIAKLKK